MQPKSILFGEYTTGPPAEDRREFVAVLILFLSLPFNWAALVRRLHTGRGDRRQRERKLRGRAPASEKRLQLYRQEGRRILCRS